MTKITEALSKMRELVLSWNLKDAVKFAETEAGLKALATLLNDSNQRVRLRALSVLSEILRRRKFDRNELMELFFEPLMRLINSGNEKTCLRALPLLRELVRGAHLHRDQFEKLLATVFSIAEECGGVAWNEVVELLKATPILVMPESLALLARDHLKSNNPRTAVLGAYLMVQSGDPLDDIGPEFSSVIHSAFQCFDPSTVELAFMGIEELLRAPLMHPLDTILLSIVPALRRISEESEDVMIRHRAREMLNALLDELRMYYQKNPWELERSVRRLVKENRKEDAILIASLLGDTSILFMAENTGPFSKSGSQKFKAMGEREV
ncbi:hypothetical protein [Thermococcus sp.]